MDFHPAARAYWIVFALFKNFSKKESEATDDPRLTPQAIPTPITLSRDSLRLKSIYNLSFFNTSIGNSFPILSFNEVIIAVMHLLLLVFCLNNILIDTIFYIPIQEAK